MDNCRDLECFVDVDKTVIVPCWRLTKEELAEVAKTGVVWIAVTGSIPPPISVNGDSVMTNAEGKPSRAEPVIPNKRIGGQIDG